MDYFEQFLYDELTSLYKKEDLTDYDYEELFYRFSSLDHVPEVKPYLLTMRYYGLGTNANPTEVSEELKAFLTSDNTALKGLYYDFLLQNDPENLDAVQKMVDLVSDGYSDTYTKKWSALHKISVKGETVESSPKNTQDDSKIKITNMYFKCGNYSGWRFPNRSVDYLACMIYFEPINCNKHITVESQIFRKGKEYSKVFYSEFDITPGARWIKTHGWGNTNFNSYSAGEYLWKIKISDGTTRQEKFVIYDGLEDVNGFPLSEVKIFSKDVNNKNYGSSFALGDINNIFFEMYFSTLTERKIVTNYVKVTRNEDNAVFVNTSLLCQIGSGSSSRWYAPPIKKQWERGLYSYKVSLGKAYEYEGTFSIY